jgi:hypothetical protein
VRESVSAGVATAERLGLQPLLESVRGAFVHGMDVMLLASAGLAGLGVLLAVALLPRRARRVVPEAESVNELVS